MTRADALFAESQRIGDAIKDHYLALRRVIGLAAVVLAGASAFGTSTLALSVAPIAVGLIALYALDVLRSMMAMSGYRRWLEEQFGQAVAPHANTLQWDSWISGQVNTSSIGKRGLFVVLYFAITYAAGFISVFAAISYDGPYSGPLAATVAGFWTAFVPATVLGAVEGTRAKRRAYDLARTGPPPITWDSGSSESSN